MSLFIEIFVSGLDKPQLVDINKADKFINSCDARGKTTRLGQIIH